jgi:hypothetical protein
METQKLLAYLDLVKVVDDIVYDSEKLKVEYYMGGKTYLVLEKMHDCPYFDCKISTARGEDEFIGRFDVMEMLEFPHSQLGYFFKMKSAIDELCRDFRCSSDSLV